MQVLWFGRLPICAGSESVSGCSISASALGRWQTILMSVDWPQRAVFYDVVCGYLRRRAAAASAMLLSAGSGLKVKENKMQISRAGFLLLVN